MSGEFSGTFDRVFDCAASQADVYEAAAAPLVADVVAGYNSTVLTYGQTGSGKTFTIFGASGAKGEDPVATALSSVQRGIIPRAVSALFNALRSAVDVEEVSIRVSFLEIYQEVVRPSS